MVSCGNQEVTSFLALLRSDVAICRHLKVTSGEFVLGVVIDVHFLVVLCSLKLVALKEQFNLQTKIVLFRINPNLQVVKSVFVIHRIFRKIIIVFFDFKEFVVLWV